MGLESGDFISQLVPTNPASSDQKKQGDDHIRLIKHVLQTTFPNANQAITFDLPSSVTKTGNYTVLSADKKKTIYCNTAGGGFTLTLPTLSGSDDLWSIEVIKISSDANPVWIAPPSGTIGGYTKVRRAVELDPIRVLWTGSAFVVSRSFKAPIGSVVEFYGASLPNGLLWPDGQTFNGSDFVELAGVLGGTTKPDRRGRVAFGRDNMGVGAASRLTSAGGGVDGATVNANGGAQSHTNTIAEMAAHDHGGVTGNPTTHPADGQAESGNTAQSGSNRTQAQPGTLPDHVHSISSQGSGTAYSIVPPAIVANFGLVTE